MVQSTCIEEAPPEPECFAHEQAPDMRVRLIPGRDLEATHVAAWRKLQEANPDLANPCFSVEFTQSVAAVRDDVEVALLERNGEIAGFFPFQRRRGSRGVPVGGIVSDYHGIISRPGFVCDPQQLLKGCKLVAWDFDRLLGSQQSFTRYHKLCEPSALIDLSNGFQAYTAERRAAGTRQIDQCAYMMRRLQREIGPLRFVPQSKDPALLRLVLDWKSDQYRRSRWPDLFAKPWARGLAERILKTHNAHFSGMLSLLYAGSWIVAGHFGMRSRTVWHYWFPAYDRHFAKYSPGLLLLIKMAQHAQDFGLRSIDIGTGITLYKKRLMNSSVSVAEGSVERPSCLRLLRSARRSLSARVKSWRS